MSNNSGDGWIHKYHPKTLNDIVGHKQVKIEIAKRIRDNSIPHRILFSGNTGIGKSSFANIIARTVHCENQNIDRIENKDGYIEFFSPCNKCNSCKSILKTEDNGMFYYYNGSQVGIDTLRQLSTICESPSLIQKPKIIYIDEIQNIASGKDSTQQELLHLIEKDYGGNVYFIMATMDVSKINKAVTNRFSSHYKLHTTNITIEDYSMLAKSILDKEGCLKDVHFNLVEVADSGIELFLREGLQELLSIAYKEGDVRKFIVMLETCIYRELYTVEQIEREFGIITNTNLQHALESLFKREISVLAKMKTMLEDQTFFSFYNITYSIIINYLLYITDNSIKLTAFQENLFKRWGNNYKSIAETLKNVYDSLYEKLNSKNWKSQYVISRLYDYLNESKYALLHDQNDSPKKKRRM